MQNFVRRSLFLAAVFAVANFLGCKQPTQVELPPPTVTIAKSVQKDVTLHSTFVGTLSAVESVEIRARVKGFLEKINFTPSTVVKKGDLLFVIEPETYKAQLEKAKAELMAANARYALASLDLERAEKLITTKAISTQELNTRQAMRDEAAAAVLASQATIQQAELNYSYTHINAPITGQVNRWLVDAGNLVGSGQDTLLTTIVKMDPIYFYFDVSENSVLQYLAWRRSLKKKRGVAQVSLGLANEDGFPHKGEIDYIDNKLDTQTGTLMIRAVFKNEGGYLYPGLFGRIQIPQETIKDAILVQNVAIGNDLSGKYVLVVGEDKIVEQRPVEIGGLVEGMRIIEKGLLPDETYIVSGLQQARPGRPVITKQEKTLPPKSGPVDEVEKVEQVEKEESQ